MTDTAVTRMNETPTNEVAPTPAASPATDGLLVSGSVPRLGEAPIIPPAPLAGDVPTLLGDAPVEPAIADSPTLDAPTLPTLDPPTLDAPTPPTLNPPTLPAPNPPTLDAPTPPTLNPPTLDAPAPDAAPAPTNEPVAAMPVPVDGADLPQLPDAAPAIPTPVEDHPGDETESPDDDGEPAHPMAHLMPAKSKPSPAQQRAAEARAVKKKKAKKIKIGVAAVALIVSALVGPPLVSWLTTAIGEAGSSPSEEPAD